MSARKISKKKASTPQNRRRKKCRLLKLVLLSLLIPVIYLTGSGPVLWSRTLVSNETYRRGVIYYVAPLMWANYRLRNKSFVEQMGVPDLSPAPNTVWYNWLEAYWGLFGDRTLREADRITLILKFRFAGIAEVPDSSETL
jgi:hypothetical protein